MYFRTTSRHNRRVLDGVVSRERIYQHKAIRPLQYFSEA